jgi:hypothetical protein
LSNQKVIRRGSAFYRLFPSDYGGLAKGVEALSERIMIDCDHLAPERRQRRLVTANLSDLILRYADAGGRPIK